MQRLTDWSELRPTGLPIAGEVHLWYIDLDNHFENHLSDEEQQRANGMRLQKVKRRFIAGRSALRSILARYLNQSPTMQQFSYGEHGRPSLNPNPAQLDFNLSHCRSNALLGISSTSRIGVDIEQLRPRKNLLAIAKKQFGEQQYQLLSAMDETDRIRHFFELWTRMEAQLKARGGSIFGNPNQPSPEGETSTYLLPPDQIASLHLLGSPIKKLSTFRFM